MTEAAVTDVTDTLIIDVPRARTSYMESTVTSVIAPPREESAIAVRRDRSFFADRRESGFTSGT